MKAKLITYYAAPTGIITLTFEPKEGPHSILCGRAEDFPGIVPDSEGGTFDIGILGAQSPIPSPVLAGSPEAEPPPGGWPLGTLIVPAGSPVPIGAAATHATAPEAPAGGKAKLPRLGKAKTDAPVADPAPTTGDAPASPTGPEATTATAANAQPDGEETEIEA